MLAEKPDAALHIAEALDPRGQSRKSTRRGIPIYEVERESERVLVCSALGHLYKVDEVGPAQRTKYPVWEYVWKPIHVAERNRERQRNWLTAITEIANKSENFVCACDFDVEGSLIGYMILKYACSGADAKAKRMKFSTLTRQELRDAYENMLPQLDFPVVNAGLCRHEVDWLYGINLSRALTESARRSSGRYATLSTGRVQGPTLRFVVEREQEIGAFVPIPYWDIEAIVEINGETIRAEYEVDKFEIKRDAEQVASLSDQKRGLITEIESRSSVVASPFPFDLSSLQAEAYRQFGISPRYTLGIAERLYLDALISYPRTSSQKLPPSIGYRRVLEVLRGNPTYAHHATVLLGLPNLRPNEGKKTDPAHPAVYPTGTPPKRSLEPRESKIYDLIVKRFMATFAPPASRETIKATIAVDGLKFYLRASHIQIPGWIDFYSPYAKFEDIDLPPIKKGDLVLFKSVRVIEKLSNPPPRYNPSSLLREMEAHEIGTKATRAEIIETLARRGYVTGNKIEATQLGHQIFEVLERYCPRVIDIGFTRELEEMMTNIELGREQKQRVVDESINHLKPIMDELKAHENEIGEQLSLMPKQTSAAKLTLLVACPKCGRTLRVVKSRKTGKRFIGCVGKWEAACDFTLPLPQLGRLTLLDERCSKCGFQLIRVTSKGRRPLVTCQICYVKRS